MRASHMPDSETTMDYPFALTLVIPTFNRAALLAEALKSVARSDVAVPSSIEVIVVDNNSSDSTRETVAGVVADGFPFALRYVFEAKQGLSYARNCGLKEGHGRLISFMDDDQRLDKRFFANIEHEMRATDADCIGGPVFYHNADDLPDWLPELLEHVGQFDGGPEVKLLEPGDRMLIGGNMTFRRAILQSIGGYNVSLGRRGNSLLASEEVELQERLLEAGKRIVYTPNLVQYHYLRPERLTRGYWRRHKLDKGRTVYRQDRIAEEWPEDALLLGAPRWFWRLLLAKDIPKYARALFNRSEESFSHQLDICFRLGQIYEARQMNRDRGLD